MPFIGPESFFQAVTARRLSIYYTAATGVTMRHFPASILILSFAFLPQAWAGKQSISCLAPKAGGEKFFFSLESDDRGAVHFYRRSQKGQEIVEDKVVSSRFQLRAKEKTGDFDLVGDRDQLIAQVHFLPLVGRKSGELVFNRNTYNCDFGISPLALNNEDAEYASLVQEWETLKKKQRETVCDEAVANQAIHTKRPDITVLFLPGFAVQNGWAAAIFMEEFSKMGMNVLLPRWKGHFTEDPREIDRISAEEWIQQTDEAYQIAKRMSPKVIVAGYSMGGLLASRLALLHPKEISALIAFSPAWRLTTGTSIGSSLGSLLGLSANDLWGKKVEKCSTYVSAHGGKEIERAIDSIERLNHQNGSVAPAASIFRKFAMPTFVANMGKDDTVDAEFIRAIRDQVASNRHANLYIPKGGHTAWIMGGGWDIPYTAEMARSTFPGSINAQLKRFFQVNRISP